jgi:hypothetical protein
VRALGDLSVLYALPLFAVVFAAVAVVAHSALRTFVSPERLSEHHEVAGFLMGVVGVLYSVVLGFLVGTVWTGFASAQQTSDLEAGYVGDAFNFAGQMQAPQRAELQRAIARYAMDVRGASWGAGGGPQDTTGQLLYGALRTALSAPAGAVREGVLRSLQSLGDTRRLRLVQARSRLPAGMLEALLLGAAFVIAFTFFFGVRSYAKQMTMTALLAGSIGLFFGLILELSTPYSGSVQVSRGAWTYVIESNHLAELAR